MRHARWIIGWAAIGVARIVQAQTTTSPAPGSSPNGLTAIDPVAKSAPPAARESHGSSKGTSAPAAPDNSSQETMKPGASFAANQIAGQIMTVDKARKEVTIDQRGKTLDLKLTESATVFVNGRLGSLEDLKEGQQVRAAFEERGGQRNLRWIEVTQARGDQGGSVTPGKQSMNQNPTIIGTLVSVDSNKSQVVLQHGGQTSTLTVQGDAPIFLNGQRASFADLAEGEQVNASLDAAKASVTQVDIIAVGANSKKGKQDR
jgi:Cu/Ag efflux protein CusF